MDLDGVMMYEACVEGCEGEEESSCEYELILKILINELHHINMEYLEF